MNSTKNAISQEHLGCASSFNQLNKTMNKKLRKKPALPGGHLQPLLRNNAIKTKLSGTALPGIVSPIEDKYQSVLTGDLSSLPTEEPTSVILYLSSEHSDMKRERDHLMKFATPRLISICREMGLHFELIDLKWGVSDLTSAEWMTSTTHMRHNVIKTCQNVSIGAYYVSLLGNKYGFEEITEWLSTSELEELKSAAGTFDQSLLFNECYTMDENQVPPAYRLKSGIDPEDAALLRNALRQAIHKLRSVDNLASAESGATSSSGPAPNRRSSAGPQTTTSALNERRLAELLSSPLELDLECGVFSLKAPRIHCACFRREFIDLEEHMNSGDIGDYVDLDEDGNMDADKADRLKKLCFRVQNHLQTSNYNSYFLKFNDPTAFESYLKNLEDDFVNSVSHYIRTSVTLKNKEIEIDKATATLYTEVLHHMTLANEQLKHASLDKEIMAKIENYLQEGCHVTLHPLVVYGESCCGKSVIMAATVKSIREQWCSNDTCIVYRILGSTSSSRRIIDVVCSITDQIKAIYGLTNANNGTSSSSSSSGHGNTPGTTPRCGAEPSSATPRRDFKRKTLHNVLLEFRNTLQTVSHQFAALRPLYIVLDGLNNFHNHFEALQSLWALRNLPPGVFVIMSTSTFVDDKTGGASDILGILREQVSDHVIRVPVFSGAADLILESTLKSKGRTLTSEQRSAVLQAASAQPLLLRLLVLKSLEWRSDYKVDADSLPHDIQSYVNSLVDQMEAEVGVVLTRATLSLLAVSDICDSTTNSVLARDAEVAQELEARRMARVEAAGELSTSQEPNVKSEAKEESEDNKLSDETPDSSDQHARRPDPPLPPSGQNTQDSEDLCSAAVVSPVPPLLIGRIRYLLTPLLKKMNVHGQRVMAYCNLCVYEHVAARFGVVFKGCDKSLINKESTDTTLKLHRQLLSFYTQGDMIYDEMTLFHLPSLLIPLIPLHGLQEFKQLILFNFDWMRHKFMLTSAYDVEYDYLQVMKLCERLREEPCFADMKSRFHCRDVQIVYEFVRDCPAPLDSQQLAHGLLSRLFAHRAEHPETVGRLLTDATCWLNTHPSLFPLCSPRSGGAACFHFAGCSHLIGVQTSDSVAMFSQSNGEISIWCLQTSELRRTFTVHKEQSFADIKATTSLRKAFIIVTHYSYVNKVMEMRVFGTLTGVELLRSTFSHRFDVISLSPSEDILLVATSIPTTIEIDGQMVTTTHKCLLGVDIASRNVVYTLVANDIHPQGTRHVRFLTLDDNQCILSVGVANEIALWNLASQSNLFCLQTDKSITDFCIHEETSSAFFLHSDSGEILILDLIKGEVKHTIQSSDYIGSHQLQITKSGGHILFITASYVAVYSIEKDLRTKEFVARDPVTCLFRRPTRYALDSSGTLLAVGYWDGGCRVYDVETKRSLWTSPRQPPAAVATTTAGSRASSVAMAMVEPSPLATEDAAVNTVDWMKGCQLLTAGNDNNATLWDLTDTLSGHVVESVLEDGLQFDNNHDDGGNDDSSKMTGNSTPRENDSAGSEAYLYPSLGLPVNQIYLSRNGSLLLTCSPNSPIRIWDTKSGRLKLTLNETRGENNHEIVNFFTSEDEKIIVSHNLCEDDDKARTLKIWSKESMARIGLGIDKIYTSHVISNQQILVIAPAEKIGLTVGIYDLLVCKSISSLTCEITGEMDATNLNIVGVSTCCIRNTDKVEKQVQYVLLEYRPHCLQITYYFTFIVDESHTISMIHEEPLRFDTHVDARYNCPCVTIFMPNNRLCLTATIDGALVLWSAITQEIHAKFVDPAINGHRHRLAHNRCITSVAVNSDGYIATGDVNGVLKFWNQASRSLLFIRRAHTDKVTCLSTQGSLVASCCLRGDLVVSNLRSGQTIYTFTAVCPLVKVTFCEDILAALTNDDKLVVLRSTLAST